MRIKKITIDSFGGIKNWTSEMDDNLVVVYGPNESGKSTISEFIRSTLFPSKNVKYPVPAKTDSGILEVEMDSGDVKVLVRDQKTVTEGTGKKTVAISIPFFSVSKNAQPKHLLLPIPADERINNPKLTQNPDWN